MKPMLAESIDIDSLDRYLNDDGWFAQQKLDGDRILICAGDDGVTALNRQGEERRNAVPRSVLAQFEGMPGSWCFDGELVDGVLWLFDMPKACDQIGPSTALEFRLSVLERFFAGWQPAASVRLLPTCRSTADKRRLFMKVQANGAEGIVLKRSDSAYRQGRRSAAVLKAKLTKTCEAVVTAIGVDGKTNCHYSMFDNGRLVEVGSCSLAGKPAVVLGDVIELRYLYASDDRRLYQPRMLRVRHDKSPAECTIDQLVFTDRTIVPIKEKPMPARPRQTVITGVSKTVGRFEVEPQELQTECACPEPLCTHPDGLRYFQVWIVWDPEKNDYADDTTFRLKRDAVAWAKANQDGGKPK